MENLEGKIKEIGGRRVLYKETSKKVLREGVLGIQKGIKDLGNGLKKEIEKSGINVRENYKNIGGDFIEVKDTFLEVMKFLSIGSMPSKIQDYLFNKYLAQKGELEDPKSATAMTLVFESLPLLSYFLNGYGNSTKLHTYLTIGTTVDIIGRVYRLTKRKSSGLGEGILELPRMIRDGLDYLCLKYTEKN